MKINRVLHVVRRLIPVALTITCLLSLCACTVYVNGVSFNCVTGKNGIDFKIWYPVISNQRNISEFGGSSEIEDNAPALLSAIAYAKQNPGTRIVFDKGTYRFNSQEKLLLDGVSDFELDGSGSTFVFGTADYFVVENGCSRITFKNFNVEWDFSKLRIFDLIKTVGAGHSDEYDCSYTDFEFVNATDIPEENNFRTISDFDINKKVMTRIGGDLGSYVIKTEKIAPNVMRVFHNYPMPIGDYSILRQYVAESQVFSLQNGSHDITVDGVNIYSALGYGFLINSKCYAIQFINSSITDNPENRLYMSTTADGMHIADAAGKIFVDNCEFSYMGDDCINIHQSMYEIHERIDDNTILMRDTAWYSRITVGEKLEIYKPTLEKAGFEATVIDIKTTTVDNYPYLILTLDKTVPAEVGDKWFTASLTAKTDTYVITNNYFHQHRARSILAEAGNGYIANNTFYRSHSSAIWITGDMFWGSLWREGVDIDNVLIENNTFESCNEYNYAVWKDGIIYIDALVNGGSTSTAYITNVTIQNNVFKSNYGMTVNARAIKGLDFSANTVDNRETDNPDRNLGVFSGIGTDITADSNTWYATSLITSESNAIRGRGVIKTNNSIISE